MENTKSLKWNVSANFIGLGYTTIVGIVVFPLYLKYLGAEAFGLVGFFTVLQAWMQLLDMGLSPILSRQAALARGQSIDFLELKKLLRSLEVIFFIFALTVVFSIVYGSNWIANNWLNVKSLEISEVVSCIVLMGLIISLRFFSALYRSGIQGMENQVRLNVVNMILVSFKFVGALLLLHFVTQNLLHFFVYQFLIGIIELMILAAMFYRLLPSTNAIGIGFFWNTLKPLAPFAGGIAYATVIWVLLTQLDKMILSNILPLAEYGYFALAMVIATGIGQISGPISQAILPRMTSLLSQGKEQDMLLLYRKSTQLMAVTVLPLAGVVAMFSTELVYAWTGDRVAAEWAGPILFWYALGNGVLAISAFQYYLQFAHGKLRMHVIFNTISASIQIPVIIYVAFEWGAMAVALAWFLLRLVSFIIWTPIVHFKFAPGLHGPWLLKDVMPFVIFTSACLFFAKSINIRFDTFERLEVFALLLGIGFVILVVNVLASGESRKLVVNIAMAIKVRLKGFGFKHVR